MNEGHTSSSSDSDSLSDEEMPTSTQRNPFTGKNKGGQGTANTPTVNLTSQEHLDNAFRLLGGRVAGAEAGSPSSGRDHRSQRLFFGTKEEANSPKAVVSKLTAVLQGRGIDLPIDCHGT